MKRLIFFIAFGAIVMLFLGYIVGISQEPCDIDGTNDTIQVHDTVTCWVHDTIWVEAIYDTNFVHDTTYVPMESALPFNRHEHYIIDLNDGTYVLSIDQVPLLFTMYDSTDMLAFVADHKSRRFALKLLVAQRSQRD